MENNVPYIVFESSQARMERTNRRLWITTIILIALLFLTNGAWIYYESQFEDTVITQENADGVNNYVGNDGDIFNGETNSKN